jgi:predicted lipoprotein with Yx(FWY)xxD motif
MSTRLARVVAVFAALALVGAGVALAAAVTVNSAKNPTLGKIVVNSRGFTLYHNTKEKKGLIKCTGSCTAVWPPLIVGKPAPVKAGHGINLAKLGKIKRPDGRFQVTYYGQPLYRYAPDTKAGQIGGEGIGGIWFALKTNGALAKTTSGTTTNTTTSTIPGYP